MSLDGPIRRILANGGGGTAKSASPASSVNADPCPSPEIFAAYYEHSLDPEETERYDAHIASCATCRATLAGVARAAVGDDVALIAEERGSRWNWRRIGLWLVPAAAAACVVFLALSLHQRSSATREQASAVAELRSAPAPSSEPFPTAPPPPPASASQPSAVPEAAPAPDRKSREPVAALKMPEMPKRSAPAPVPPALSASANAAESADAASATVEVAPSDAAPAPPQGQRDARQKSMQSFSANSAMALAKKPKAAAPPQDAPAKQAKDHLTISAPDSSITWTIHTNHVQYTENGTPAPVQDFLPTNSAIAAGSAPGGKTCWLVGSGGAVVRTTDGRNWLAATPPTSADLTAITAQNARSATVTTADGKTYSTTDGGSTWKSGQ